MKSPVKKVPNRPGQPQPPYDKLGKRFFLLEIVSYYRNYRQKDGRQHKSHKSVEIEMVVVTYE